MLGDISSGLELLYNPRVNKVFTSIHFTFEALKKPKQKSGSPTSPSPSAVPDHPCSPVFMILAQNIIPQNKSYRELIPATSIMKNDKRDRLERIAHAKVSSSSLRKLCCFNTLICSETIVLTMHGETKKKDFLT